jgi:ribonuclease Z
LITVKASWIKHRVATFGFVIEQKPLQGKLDVDGLKKRGIMPGPIYNKIKQEGKIKLDNGQIVIKLNKLFSFN